jgi:hypothetical protein
MHANLLRKQTTAAMVKGRHGHLDTDTGDAAGTAQDQAQKLQSLAETLGLTSNKKSADDGDLGYDLFKACVNNLFKLYARRATGDDDEDENSYPREEKALVLDVRGWMRMCHRMQIFSNHFGYIEAFKLFREVAEDPMNSAFGKTRELQAADFKTLMNKLGRELFKSASAAAAGAGGGNTSGGGAAAASAAAATGGEGGESANETRSKLTARILVPYLTKEDARRFRRQVRTAEGARILIHCPLFLLLSLFFSSFYFSPPWRFRLLRSFAYSTV